MKHTVKTSTSVCFPFASYIIKHKTSSSHIVQAPVLILVLQCLDTPALAAVSSSLKARPRAGMPGGWTAARDGGLSLFVLRHSISRMHTFDRMSRRIRNCTDPERTQNTRTSVRAGKPVAPPLIPTSAMRTVFTHEVTHGRPFEFYQQTTGDPSGRERDEQQNGSPCASCKAVHQILDCVRSGFRGRMNKRCIVYTGSVLR